MEERELIVLRGKTQTSALITLELERRQNRKQSKHGTEGQANRMSDRYGYIAIEERKTGKWIKFSNSCTIRCNQCGQEMTSLCDIKLPNYCPNCGAKMEEGEQP